MPTRAVPTNLFVLQAFDVTLWCPVAEARFTAPDLEILRAILGDEAADDPALSDQYSIDEPCEFTMIAAEFGVGFPESLISRSDIEIIVYKIDDGSSNVPYLPHTGYELALMIDGRKKLTKMCNEYPPMTFDGEESFDRWVEDGLLHKEVTVEPFERPRGSFHGLRTVYYTVKDEEWRIPATKLIWQAAQQSGGWNEHFERLEGMLFGYEQWQNDWWIKHRRTRRVR